jgi:hypothetical protein
VLGQAVDPTIMVAIEPSASIAHVTSMVSRVTADVLREQVGVTDVKRPAVRVTYDDLAVRPVRGGRPAPPELPPLREEQLPPPPLPASSPSILGSPTPPPLATEATPLPVEATIRGEAPPAEEERKTDD